MWKWSARLFPPSLDAADFFLNDQGCEAVNGAQTRWKEPLRSSSQTKEGLDGAFIIAVEWAAHVLHVILERTGKAAGSILIYIQSQKRTIRYIYIYKTWLSNFPPTQTPWSAING